MPSHSAEIRQFPQGPRVGASGRSLIKEIFRADSPEEYARELPAQSIYLAIRSSGLEAAPEVLALIEDAQYKVVLDLDFWVGDNFSEKHFWQWVQVLDQEGGREELTRLVELMDARLLGLLFSRYVVVNYPEEPTDLPPDKGYYTPDRGGTWIKILLDDPDQHRRFGKLLALLYDHNAELFYQLLSEGGFITAAELEEGAYSDKVRRLLDEGMPSSEVSFRLNTPVNAEQLEKLMAHDHEKSLPDNPTVLPLAFSLYSVEPLSGFLSELVENGRQEEVEAELALLANAAIVFYNVDIAETTEVGLTIEKIRGAINIGLERISRSLKVSPREVFERFGLQKIYQLGLGELRDVQRAAKKLGEEGEVIDDHLLAAIHAGASLRFPVLPVFVQRDGSIQLEGDAASAETKAYQHLAQTDAVKRLLQPA